MNHQLDARYMLCPMPVIKTQNKIAELRPGDVLEVRCTDPGALYDIPAWCKVHGHELLSAQKDADGCVVRVRVVGPAA